MSANVNWATGDRTAPASIMGENEFPLYGNFTNDSIFQPHLMT